MTRPERRDPVRAMRTLAWVAPGLVLLEATLLAAGRTLLHGTPFALALDGADGGVAIGAALAFVRLASACVDEAELRGVRGGYLASFSTMTLANVALALAVRAGAERLLSSILVDALLVALAILYARGRRRVWGDA